MCHTKETVCIFYFTIVPTKVCAPALFKIYTVWKTSKEKSVKKKSTKEKGKQPEAWNRANHRVESMVLYVRQDVSLSLIHICYLLENEKLRLYYTAAGDEAHNFIVLVEDNFNNSCELEIDFNNRNGKDDIQTVIPMGNFKPLPR